LVRDLGIFHNSVPLIQLNAASHILLMPKKHLVLCNAYSS
jgi:hypothetical protein